MSGEESKIPCFEAVRGHGWWFRRWASRRVAAGVTSRGMEADGLLRHLPWATAQVSAEQVHGSSVAMIERCEQARTTVCGADALLTRCAGVALLVRTADCLPVFFADAQRGVVGIAHAGWRGVAAGLPARVVSALRRHYGVQARELSVAIGPAIRSCCYEVGGEFTARFGRFVQERGGRRTCDLVGAATAQLLACGIRAERLFDCGRCTVCEADRWWSVRRDGQAAGRLTSLIVIRP